MISTPTCQTRSAPGEPVQDSGIALISRRDMFNFKNNHRTAESAQRYPQRAPFKLVVADHDEVGDSSFSSEAVVRSLTELAILTVLVACVPLVVAVDVIVFENGVSEHSLTEYTQATFLLISATTFAVAARKHPNRRGFLVLPAGLFGCMFIRELDGLLDRISHGFWFFPAIALAAITITYASKYRDTIKETLYDFLDARSATLLSIGLLVTLLFSRMFGTGHLWNLILPDGHGMTAKTIIQEGLELLGDLLVVFGAVSYYTTIAAGKAVVETGPSVQEATSESTPLRRTA